VLADYLSEESYRFQMQFSKGSFAEFYAPTSEQEEVLGERRKWLKETPKKYLALTMNAGEIVDEFREMAEDEGVFPKDGRHGSEADVLLSLGQKLEPDFLLLVSRGDAIRLVAGVVCFPSSWALEEKMGRAIEEIHGVVPGLNGSIGNSIQTFLQKLKSGVSWNRTNWGLTPSAERNQHPSRGLPRLDEKALLHEIFFRVEEQSLVALPRTRSILFGIRLRITSLEDLKREETARARLIKALQTMPEEMAQYKGLARGRTRVIELLR